jgi:hypothetical protein
VSARLLPFFFALVLPACDLDLSQFVHYSRTTEIASLEEDVVEMLADNGLQGASASCPNKVFENDQPVECTVTMPGDHTFEAIVVLGEGTTLSMGVENGAVHPAALADSVHAMLLDEAKARGVDPSEAPTVDCGQRFVLERKGERVLCTVEHGDDAMQVALTLDGNGAFSMKPAKSG